MSTGTRKWLLAVPCIYFLFFFGLTEVGLLGPDEPRYASIGREMARSGDWVTPRLWGEPWFEKPPLLYWMIGAAFRAGLSENLAPRLPVALASVVFLLFYHRTLWREFGARAALLATAILATSAAWLGFSEIAATDLPMSAAFSAAMLLCLRWIESGERWMLVRACVLLGVAVLAKGLVPLALAAPLAWMGRRRLKDWRLPLAVLVLTAAPWYVLCTLRYGERFLGEFFWRHHLERFSSDALMHQQPFWFYLPVFLAGLFPWTPLLVLLARKSFYADDRRKFLLLWLLFGLLFFSVSANKLPGYLLPLFPAAAALLGIALAEAKESRWVLAPACLLLLLVPVIAGVLPKALLAGLSRAHVAGWHWIFSMTIVSFALLIWWWEDVGSREGAVGLLVLATLAGVVFLKVKTFPELDRMVSVRHLWGRIAPVRNEVCVERIHRSLRYGLNYYSVDPLPDCAAAPRPIHLRQEPGQLPHLKL